MGKYIFTLVVLFLSIGKVEAQEESLQQDSVLYTFVHLKSGDVLQGQLKEQNDSSITLQEKYAGLIHIDQKNVRKVENVISNSKVKLTLPENVKLTGTLIGIIAENYILQTEDGIQFEIDRREIIEIEIFEGDKKVSGNPNATRYFFAPSAIPLNKGEGYYHNAYLLSNAANFGVTNNFSFGGGIIIPIVFYITPKVSFEVRKNFYLGGGMIAATTIIPGAWMSGGIPYALATAGTMETNLTLGVGYGLLWDEDGFTRSDKPIITLNGMWRLNKRIQLVTENWIVPYVGTQETDNSYTDGMGNWIYVPPTITEHNGIFTAISLGTRIMLNKRSSFDIAPLMLAGTNMTGIVVPYIDFAYKF